MPSREVKLQTFDRFLQSVTGRYAPDLIYVACNTLSVLLPDTPYFHKAVIPVKGIVETGAELLVRELEADPRSAARSADQPLRRSQPSMPLYQARPTPWAPRQRAATPSQRRAPGP